MTAVEIVLVVLAAAAAVTVGYVAIRRREMRRALDELLRGVEEREARERLGREGEQLKRDVAGLRAELAALKRELVRREAVAAAHAAVAKHVPAESVVLVVSRGDEELVSFERRTGWHFPQEANGVYAGHHPENSEEAVAHLEAVREHGAEFLLIPGTAAWWLEHYEGFREHLERCCSRVVSTDDGSVIYALAGQDPRPGTRRLRTVSGG